MKTRSQSIKSADVQLNVEENGVRLLERAVAEGAGERWNSGDVSRRSLTPELERAEAQAEVSDWNTDVSEVNRSVLPCFSHADFVITGRSTSIIESHQIYDVNIDFDDASAAWRMNKKSTGGGCYKYICEAKTLLGNNCLREPILGCAYCKMHNKSKTPSTNVSGVPSLTGAFGYGSLHSFG